MAQDADELNLQPETGQDSPAHPLDDASLDVELESETPSDDQAAADGAENADEGIEWPTDPAEAKIAKAMYTKATQKYSAQLKTAQAELAAAQAQREALKDQADFYRSEIQSVRQPKAPDSEPSLPEGVDPSMITKMDALFKKTPTYQEMMKDREATRSIMASKPEAFIEPDDVDPQILAEITPELRRIVANLPRVDKDVLKTVALSVAAPRQAKLLKEMKAERAKLEKLRAAKRSELQKAKTAASGGMAAGSSNDFSLKDLPGMSESLEEAFKNFELE